MTTKQYHIALSAEDVAPYVLLPGDPGRVEKIAQFLEDPYFVAQNREYTTWNGTLLGENVSIVSTGIGSPSTAIALEELVACGATTFIRVGTAGRLSPETKVGDFVVATAAIRDEGTSSSYLPMEFPAVADPFMAYDLWTGANQAVEELMMEEEFRRSVHLGVTHSKDAFYGQETSAGWGPMGSTNTERLEAWKAGGALCSEMEASALFTGASVHKVRAGAVLSLGGTLDGSPMTQEEAARQSDEILGRVARKALRNVIRQDQGF